VSNIAIISSRPTLISGRAVLCLIRCKRNVERRDLYRKMQSGSRISGGDIFSIMNSIYRHYVIDNINSIIPFLHVKFRHDYSVVSGILGKYLALLFLDGRRFD